MGAQVVISANVDRGGNGGDNVLLVVKVAVSYYPPQRTKMLEYGS